MNKSAFKTLSVSVLTFVVAATSSAYEQAPFLPPASSPVTSEKAACSAQQEIDLGWEYQLGMIEARIEAKEPASIEVKGAIISPPFRGFPTYRTDVPSVVARSTESGDSGVIGHEPSSDRF